ncbi:hypothetical protein KSP39_PZI016547 [Platanthera zijinensis]|uniref:Uncharacterized protein n=1 Tax=Platanthera zijinensis TaxID=2320716 RepID=A0AAP0B6R9_9ASPA
MAGTPPPQTHLLRSLLSSAGEDKSSRRHLIRRLLRRRASSATTAEEISDLGHTTAPQPFLQPPKHSSARSRPHVEHTTAFLQPLPPLSLQVTIALILPTTLF